MESGQSNRHCLHRYFKSLSQVFDRILTRLADPRRYRVPDHLLRHKQFGRELICFYLRLIFSRA